MDEEWVVLIEATDPTGSSAIDRDALDRLLDALSTDFTVALHHADRYALQLSLRAASAAEALRSTVVHWRSALDRLGLPAGILCRADVLTVDEFDRDLAWASALENQGGPGGPSSWLYRFDGLAGDAGPAEQLLHEAFHDSLTGLADAELFRDHLRVAIERDAPVLLLVVDIDRFAAVNARHGHIVGDQVLVELAARLSRWNPSEVDTVARLGGDRFGILLEGPSAADRASRAEALLGALADALAVGGQTLRFTGSVGWVGTRGGEDPDAVLRQAAAAMRAAKAAGGNRAVAFDPKLHSAGPGTDPALGAALSPTALLGLLQRVASIVSHGDDFTVACASALEDICLRTGWPVGHVHVVDPGGSRVTLSGCQHLAAPRYRTFSTLASGAAVERGQRIPGQVLATGRPAWSVDLPGELEPEAAAAAAVLSLLSTVAFPVMVADEVVAVVEFFAHTAFVPDWSTLEVLSTVGLQLGWVAERNRDRAARADADRRVTDRGHAEDAVGESERRWQVLLKTIGEEFLLVGPDGSGVRLFGTTSTDTGVPETIAGLVHPDDAQALLDAVRACAGTGNTAGPIHARRAVAAGGGSAWQAMSWAVIDRTADLGDVVLHGRIQPQPVDPAVTTPQAIEFQLASPGGPRVLGHIRRRWESAGGLRPVNPRSGTPP